MHISKHICMYMYIPIYVQIDMYTYFYIYIYTYIYMYIYFKQGLMGGNGSPNTHVNEGESR